MSRVQVPLGEIIFTPAARSLAYKKVDPRVTHDLRRYCIHFTKIDHWVCTVLNPHGEERDIPGEVYVSEPKRFARTTNDLTDWAAEGIAQLERCSAKLTQEETGGKATDTEIRQTLRYLMESRQTMSTFIGILALPLNSQIPSSRSSRGPKRIQSLARWRNPLSAKVFLRIERTARQCPTAFHQPRGPSHCDEPSTSIDDALG
ncbi:hypothetical protein NliqN6_6281 [Naganishia liquefaciens]|uniref:Uncharacterized protein n=1 Tax=Naganishia liquefaciens TaxID=104408 RepID=A0A8H3TZC4_9TREE|nr:hypothetical protein NliqN6_6281 [Naganishia liquefaciens]